MIVSFGNKNKSPAFPSAFSSLRLPSLRFLRCVSFAAFPSLRFLHCVFFAQWLKPGGRGKRAGRTEGRKCSAAAAAVS